MKLAADGVWVTAYKLRERTSCMAATAVVVYWPQRSASLTACALLGFHLHDSRTLCVVELAHGASFTLYALLFVQGTPTDRGLNGDVSRPAARGIGCERGREAPRPRFR